MKKCDLCGARMANLVERCRLNGEIVEISLCEVCYKTTLKSGLSALDVVLEKRAKQGRVCPECGCTVEEFEKNYLFGCPACYENMRKIALEAAAKAQGACEHTGKRVCGGSK